VMLDAVTPRLRTGAKMLTRAIRVEAPEGDVAPGLGRVQAEFGEVAMGSYPFFEKGRLGTNLVLRSTDEHLLARAFDATVQMLESEGITNFQPVDG